MAAKDTVLILQVVIEKLKIPPPNSKFSFNNGITVICSSNVAMNDTFNTSVKSGIRQN